MAGLGEKQTLETKQKISQSLKGRTPWNKGLRTSEIEKAKIGLGRKGLFSWIKDKNLRKIVVRDFATASVCEDNELFKPAIILYASVSEALLKYALEAEGTEKFSNLIKTALGKRLVKKHQKDKLNVIRDFRNYVHIHEELEHKFEITKGLAQLSRETCTSVAEELRA